MDVRISKGRLPFAHTALHNMMQSVEGLKRKMPIY